MKKKMFRSQVEYENGFNMCTCCAVMWAVSMVCKIFQNYFNEKHMHLLMQSAQELYVKIRQKNHESLLQQFEVFENMNVTSRLVIREFFATDSQTLKDFACDSFEQLVDIEKFLASIQHQSACILTFDRHSVAVYRHKAQYIFFDSMPACVVVCDDFAEFWRYFKQTYNTVTESTLNLIFEQQD